MLVWVIDDEPAVLNMISTALAYKGHEIEVFDDPDSALQKSLVLERMPHVVFVDWLLGVLPGIDLVRRLQLRMPAAAFVLMSGDPARASQLPEGVHWLGKPFRLNELYRFTG